MLFVVCLLFFLYHLEHPKLPNDYLKRSWDILNSALSAIYYFQSCPFSYEELYREVQNLCIQKMEPIIYQRLCSSIETYVKHIFLSTQIINDSTGLLNIMAKKWRLFCSQMVISTTNLNIIFLSKSYFICFRKRFDVFFYIWIVPIFKIKKSILFGKY